MTRAGVAGLVSLLLTAGVWASGTYTPPPAGAWAKTFVYLQPPSPNGQTAGVVFLACNTAESQFRCQLYARGLQPGATYTLWLVGRDAAGRTRRQRINSWWRGLRADAAGVLNFRGKLPRCPVKGDRLVLLHHSQPRRRGFAAGAPVLRQTLWQDVVPPPETEATPAEGE